MGFSQCSTHSAVGDLSSPLHQQSSVRPTSTDNSTARLLVKIDGYFDNDVEAESLLSLAATTALRNSPKNPPSTVNEEIPRTNTFHENNGEKIQTDSSDDVVIVKTVRKKKLSPVVTPCTITRSAPKKISCPILE